MSSAESELGDVEQDAEDDDVDPADADQAGGVSVAGSPGAAPDGGRLVRRLDDWSAATLRSLAEEYGAPLYLMDLDRVRENYRRLDDALPDVEVLYAAKAHTGRAVLETLRDEGAGIEVSGAGELRRALSAGYDDSEIYYTAVNPPASDLDSLVEVWEDHPELTVTAGAEDTIERLRERGYDGRLSVRVNPGVGAGHHEKVAVGADAQFGVPRWRAVGLLEDAAEQFEVVGLHCHVGSGMLGDDLEQYREALGRVAALARQADCVVDLEYVDVGGGLGVPYHEDDEPLDLDAVREAIWDAMDGVNARVVVEPGRYVVADAGVLLTRVNTVKDIPATTVAGVDASMTDLIRPALFDSYHPIRNLAADADDRVTSSVTIGGPVCSSADTFCEDRPLPHPERGDYLAIGNTGAYGYELASNFHSMPRAAEAVVEDGEVSIARQRETHEDVVRTERAAESRR